MKKLILALFLISGAAQAEGYLDVGLAIADSSYGYNFILSCSYDKHYNHTCATSGDELHGVVGTVELGYMKGPLTFYISHTSLVNERDGNGLGMAGVKARIRLFE